MTRIFDMLFSTVALVLIAPFMVPIVIGLLLTGEHHVFYLQPRIGRKGKTFDVLKFATMLKNSPNLPGGFLTQKKDPRILPMGSFLRKTKINELPQLLNIFVGQMSFVGPRPQTKTHFDLYTPEVRDKLSMVAPGLTGIGSLVFRDEEGILDRLEGDRTSFYETVIAPYKGLLEVWYCENRNLGLYFGLIFLTAWSIVRPRSLAHFRFLKTLPEPPKSLLGLMQGKTAAKD